MTKIMERTESREMKIIRTIKAPVELVWEVWTQPEHIINWWGPKGFTSTIHKFEFVIGGEWLLTMHGPDGSNFPNRSIFKEIVLNKKIVFEHFNPHFITTVLFHANENETQIEWTLLFDSAEMLQTIVRAHRADEGQKENIERLEQYISTIRHVQEKTKEAIKPM
jgi:uncharacterized protein YndB with AHSA1/START domain